MMFKIMKYIFITFIILFIILGIIAENSEDPEVKVDNNVIQNIPFDLLFHYINSNDNLKINSLLKKIDNLKIKYLKTELSNKYDKVVQIYFTETNRKIIVWIKNNNIEFIETDLKKYTGELIINYKYIMDISKQKEILKKYIRLNKDSTTKEINEILKYNNGGVLLEFPNRVSMNIDFKIDVKDNYSRIILIYDIKFLFFKKLFSKPIYDELRNTLEFVKTL